MFDLWNLWIINLGMRGSKIGLMRLMNSAAEELTKKS
jgi:hypothetical protein